MKQSGISLGNLAKGLLIGLIAALWAGAVGAGTDAPNQLRKIKITEQQGKTTITVMGSERPSYTAFRLASPKRLVLDLANSQVRGVPPLLEKETPLINGVAVSEYTVEGAPVSRVMINFADDAAYRIRTAGKDLVIVLSGAPKSAAAKKATGAKDVEQEVARARAATNDAVRGREAAEAQLATLRRENERRKVESEQARARAEDALARLADVRASLDLQRKTSKEREALAKRAARELSEAKKEVKRSQDIARQELDRREQLEKRLAALNEQLAEATADRKRAAASRELVAQAAEALEKESKQRHAEQTEARKDAAAKLAEQRKAADAYRAAAEDQRARLERVLRTKEKEAVAAQQRLLDAEKENKTTQQALTEALAELRRATAAQKRAERAESSVKTKTNKQLARAERQRDLAVKAARLAEQRTEEAVRAERAAEKRVAQIKQESARKVAETEKQAKQRLAAAKRQLEAAEEEKAAAEKRLAGTEQRLASAVRDSKEATARAAAADKRAADYEKELAQARGTIAEQEKRLDELSKPSGTTAGAEEHSDDKLTQEQLRLKRLAEMRGESPTEEPAAAPKISDVRFTRHGQDQLVIVECNAPVEYSTSADNNGNSVMVIRDVAIAPVLERTLDVTDFAGAIGQINSYGEDADVRIEVDVQRRATSSVTREGNKLIWTFRQESGVLMPTPPETRWAKTESRTVHRDDPESYAYPFERTAGQTVFSEAGTTKKRRYTGRHIDLDFKDADIHNILRLLADVGHVNIITADDVAGTVTIRMRDVAWDHALDVILQAKNLGMVRRGNLIRVAPLEALEKEREMEIARRKQKEALKPLETRLIPVSYAKANDLAQRGTELLTERGSISVDDRTNVLIARDTKESLDQVEALIRNLDTQTPQVLIEGRIVEASSTFAREIGIQWGGDFSASAATGNPTGLAFPSTLGVAGGATDTQSPVQGLGTTASAAPNPNFAVNLPAATGTGSGGALGITMGSIANNANLSLRLSAMEESGTLRILSSPKILTMDNRQASIEQGTMIPYSQVSAAGVQTSFKEAKLNLTVTPHVTADGSVLLKLEMSRDEPDFNNTGARGDPSILKRNANTELLVSDGHTAVIGGIFTRNHGTAYKKVPFFADIPILGWLFKSRSTSDRRSEMLIFITPRIVNRAESIGH